MIYDLVLFQVFRDLRQCHRVRAGSADPVIPRSAGRLFEFITAISFGEPVTLPYASPSTEQLHFLCHLLGLDCSEGIHSTILVSLLHTYQAAVART